MYYLYLNTKEQNKLYLCQENFQVIVNTLNNAIISETENENFAFCNELGLNLVKTVCKANIDESQDDNSSILNNLNNLKNMEYLVETTNMNMDDEMFKVQAQLRQLKIFKVYKIKEMGKYNS